MLTYLSRHLVCHLFSLFDASHSDAETATLGFSSSPAFLYCHSSSASSGFPFRVALHLLRSIALARLKRTRSSLEAVWPLCVWCQCTCTSSVFMKCQKSQQTIYCMFRGIIVLCFCYKAVKSGGVIFFVVVVLLLLFRLEIDLCWKNHNMVLLHVLLKNIEMRPLDCI